jgi:beta-galactosidase
METKKIYDWENLAVISRNKEEGHALADPYDDEAGAVARLPSPYRLSLNGLWKFAWARGAEPPGGIDQPDFAATGGALGGAIDGDSRWDEIPVPSVWQLQGYGQPYYYALSYPQAIGTRAKKIPQISHALQEIGVYRRSFTLPEHFAGRELYLHFGAVKAALSLFVNGREAGYSQGSMTPHEFNVTSLIRPGENQLTAVVYRYSDGTYLEDQDMWFFSGIYREVYLYAEPETHIRDFYLHANFDPALENAEANLCVYLENRRGPAARTVVTASIPELIDILGVAEVTVLVMA